MSNQKKNAEKNSPLLYVGFETSNGNNGSFDAWNPHALHSLRMNMGALDPSKWSFHVHGDLYQVPNIARKGHETGGSVNVEAVNLISGETIEFSHVFYFDITGHGGKPNHWNHELYYKKGNEEWTLFDKSQTMFHIIPDSDYIIIWARDSSGNEETKKVEKKYRAKN